MTNTFWLGVHPGLDSEQMNYISEKLEALLARQMPDAEKRRRANFVVDSAHGIEHARTQVRQILAAVAKMPTRRK